MMGTVLTQWKQELLKCILGLVLSNFLWPMVVGKGGGCTGQYFLPAAGPPSPGRRGQEGLGLHTVRFGDLGSDTRGSCRVGRGRAFEVVLSNSCLYRAVTYRA